MRSTQQIRLVYEPACQVKDRGRGFLAAWQALATVMAAFNYTPRPADTGARNCRRITGGSGYSLHSYFADSVLRFANGLGVALAVAMDINWKSNPYGPRLVTDMPRAMVDAICAIRTVDGVQVFRWGGYYSGNKDAMHFEIVASPAELARGIDPRSVHTGGAHPAPSPEPPAAPAVEEEDMQPILCVQNSEGAGFALLTPNVGAHPVVKIPLAAMDAIGGAGGLDDALRDKVAVYLRADDDVVDRIPNAG